MLNQRFDRHIERTANGILLFEYLIILKLVSKAEIAEFEHPVFQQNVCRLDVSMHDVVLREISAGQADLVGSFNPVEVQALVDEGLEGASFAVFSDDVAIITGVIQVQQFDYIGVFHLFQNFNFVFQKFSPVRLHVTCFYHLQSHHLAFIIIFAPTINRTAKTTTYHVAQAITIRAYSFFR